MTPGRAALVGLVFVAIAIVYWSVPTITGGIVDYAGTTMLLALGAATSLMAYALFLGIAGRKPS
jgi:ammonia channel protein AmtB